MQSYLVPFLIKIAIIFGPHHENYCNHNWSTPIMIFQGSRLLLRDWDLWGPLLLCMVVGTILHEGEGGPHFTQFFILFWVGSAVITLNTKLLGGSISFFQSVSHTVWVIPYESYRWVTWHVFLGVRSWILYRSTCWRSFILQTYPLCLKCKFFCQQSFFVPISRKFIISNGLFFIQVNNVSVRFISFGTVIVTKSLL